MSTWLRSISYLLFAAFLAGCVTGPDDKADATAKKRSLDADADATLTRLYTTADGSKELVRKAYGALIFPSVLAGGVVVGAEYGEGVLRSKGRTVDYYNLTSGSVGFQLGAQSKAVIVLFMTKDAYDKFRSSSGWTAGADASVALLKIGAGGSIDTNTVTQPVVGFVMTNAGLMYNLTLEGTKITRLDL